MNAITTNDDEQCILSSYSPRPWPSLLCRCDHRSLSNLLTTAECEKGIKLSKALMTNGEHRSTTTERTTMEWNRIVWRRLCCEPKVRQKTSESYNTAPGLYLQIYRILKRLLTLYCNSVAITPGNEQWTTTSPPRTILLF